MNIFRVAFSMERLVPSAITGPVADAYMQDLKRVRFLLDCINQKENKSLMQNGRPWMESQLWGRMRFWIRIIMGDSMYLHFKISTSR
jgi:hypothetical protein